MCSIMVVVAFGWIPLPDEGCRPSYVFIFSLTHVFTCVQSLSLGFPAAKYIPKFDEMTYVDMCFFIFW